MPMCCPAGRVVSNAVTTLPAVNYFYLVAVTADKCKRSEARGNSVVVFGGPLCQHWAPSSAGFCLFDNQRLFACFVFAYLARGICFVGVLDCFPLNLYSRQTLNSRTEASPMEIILARHGRPNFSHRSWITPRQMKDWIRIYNQADVHVGEAPSDALAKARGCGIVVSSALPRCTQSAQALVHSNQSFVTDAVFCEADLPGGSWNAPRLPFAMLAALFRLAWFLGYSSNAESLLQTKARARHAAHRLVELSTQNGSVFLVGHGIINMLIAKELLALGWSGPTRPIAKHWRYSVYRRPVP